MVEELQAVVFDMDGVLFDTERLYMAAWREAAVERGITGEEIEKTVIKCVGLNHVDIRNLFLREYGEAFPFEEYYRACGECFQRKVEKDGLPMKPGVKELLSYLQAEGCRIALASSTSLRGVKNHLERTGLTDYFEVIVGGDMVEHSKPQPDIYLLACRLLEVEPRKAIAIEDSPNGIRSAHRAGLHPVMVPDMIQSTPEIQALLYKECKSLLEVKEMLEQEAEAGGRRIRVCQP